jgi:hypothetical protein
MWPFRQQNGILATRQPSSVSNRVFHMKSNLAIATLIRSRMTELGLSRGELAKRLGYKNIAKGIRRIDALCEGDIEGTKQVLDVLPQALETSAETVKLACDQTVHEIELAEKQKAEARDKIWRENFCPHAIILTERTVPSPIFVAAIIGVEKLLRIDLDTQRPVSFVRRVLDRLPEGIPAFGKPIGFVINYSPDQAVRFDRKWATNRNPGQGCPSSDRRSLPWEASDHCQGVGAGFWQIDNRVTRQVTREVTLPHPPIGASVTSSKQSIRHGSQAIDFKGR